MPDKQEYEYGFRRKEDINPKSIKGEPGTGFEERGDKGPFECGNCRYWKENGKGDQGCNQDDMKAKSKQPRTKSGLVEVSKEDCCEYVDRVGEKKDE